MCVFLFMSFLCFISLLSCFIFRSGSVGCTHVCMWVSCICPFYSHGRYDGASPLRRLVNLHLLTPTEHEDTYGMQIGQYNKFPNIGSVKGHTCVYDCVCKLPHSVTNLLFYLVRVRFSLIFGLSGLLIAHQLSS